MNLSRGTQAKRREYFSSESQPSSDFPLLLAWFSRVWDDHGVKKQFLSVNLCFSVGFKRPQYLGCSPLVLVGSQHPSLSPLGACSFSLFSLMPCCLLGLLTLIFFWKSQLNLELQYLTQVFLWVRPVFHRYQLSWWKPWPFSANLAGN